VIDKITVLEGRNMSNFASGGDTTSGRPSARDSSATATTINPSDHFDAEIGARPHRFGGDNGDSTAAGDMASHGRSKAVGQTLRRRISRLHIASGAGTTDLIKIGCAFGALKVAYRVTAQMQGAPDIAIESMVSNKYRFAYCGVPKVATKSIRGALRAPEIGAFSVNRRLAELAADGSPYQSYYKFSFIRNPWSRVVSCYRDKIQILRPTAIGKLSILAKHPGLSPGLPFDAFIQWLCSAEGGDQCADRHWISQHKFVTDAIGRVICDFVGKLENIEAHFQAVCDAIRMPPIKLPHGNRSNYDKDPYSYRDFYTSRTRKLIGQRYERDVELFKYIF
jgi:Sulfotransferase family